MTKISGILNNAAWATILFLSIKQTQALDLSDAYRRAFDNSPIIKQAEAKASSLGQSKPQSIARFLPNISATAASNREWLHNKRAGRDFRGPDANQEYWNQTFSVNLKQPLFHWDHWVQLSQSNNQIAQAEAAFQAEIQSLMMKTCEAYFNVLEAQDNLEFTTAEKNSIARQLDQVKERYEMGIIPITDVHEAQAGFDQALANEIAATNNLDNQKAALSVIIGESEETMAGLGEQLSMVKPEPQTLNAWIDSSETNNLDIIAGFNQIEFLRKNIDLQKNGHLPTLDLVASYGASDVNSSFGLRGDTQSVGLQLNVPLYEGGAVNSRIQQATFDYEAAKENLNQKKLELKRLVKEAFRGVLSNMSRVEALKLSVKSAKSAVETTEEGFELGTRTMVDLLNEQRNLYRTKRDYSRSRYDYLINSLKLKYATSTLNADDIEKVNKLLLNSGSDISKDKSGALLR